MEGRIEKALLLISMKITFFLKEVQLQFYRLWKPE